MKKPRFDSTDGRPPIEECLHQDVLEAILGLLDRDTLYTARLVSKTFCASAALHVCSLTLTNATQIAPFYRFPYLRHVAVVLNCKEESLAHLEPRLRDLTTTLTVKFRPEGSLIEILSEAALMPKLRKLAVWDVMEHDAASLRRCTNLEALSLYGCSASVATTIVTMTRLTSLSIDNMLEDNDMDAVGHLCWLGLATNLRNLQSLEIGTSHEALALIGNLTGLTGLTIYDVWDAEREIAEEEAGEAGPRYSIAPLMRLTRLRTLFMREMTESNLEIAGSLGLGSLVKLELWVRDEASADCGRFLSRQTALRELSLHGWQLCNLRHIRALRIELLDCLELFNLDMLDAEGFDVLCRATSLTKLGIGTATTQPQIGFSKVLARLTQLRSLSWYGGGFGATEILDLPLAMTPLTALTKLEIRSHGLDNGDLGALLGLTGLRVLELCHCRLTDDVLPELGVLTNLHTLRIYRCSVTSLAPVIEVLDPLRKARGLRPLVASM